MPLVNSILSWIMKKRIHQIELFMKYPCDVQEELLSRLVTLARFTEYGKQYDFSTIESYSDFKSRVPVNDYESLKDLISRTMHGEQNLLWHSDIKWFAKSSGTTSDKSKFIPVSEESLEDCHFKGGKDLLSIYCSNYPDTQVFGGKLLTLGGSHSINTFNHDSYSGDLSAILIQNLPLWIQVMRTPDISIALMDEWEEKIEKVARLTVSENVTNMSGVPSWTLVLLKRVLEITGKKNITEIWPNMELFVHGAVSFTPYKSQFEKVIGKKINYLETYNASEGFFGIQDLRESDEMLLMLDYGIFYEFIPMDEIEKEFPKTLSLAEVELNKNYAIVITTNAGLWRYKIGDTVSFTSLNPYRIKITGRTAHFINAFGEELIVDNADKAIVAASILTNSHVREYTAAPIYFSDDNNGAHEWLIEFDKEPEDIIMFTQALDEELKKLNSDYEAKRYKNMTLRMPVVRKIESNSFYEWLRINNKLGGQHKIPRLANNRRYVDELLNLTGAQQTVI
ncbi:MAG TPA: GH3 auxin-responsive promoter family protein [Bacteroidia bacterium]|nr:GH3 auxin-responsive promoter family protein [Bacteroidia bacterium]HNU33900.1 GH3 auxin-responsive promoter family protein [Bacteroidia bacterium]